jgi:hypothetical protein
VKDCCAIAANASTAKKANTKTYGTRFWVIERSPFCGWCHPVDGLWSGVDQRLMRMTGVGLQGCWNC